MFVFFFFYRGLPCKVFFHFVGATPGSTDLAFFLQRLSREINVSKVINVPYMFAKIMKSVYFHKS